MNLAKESGLALLLSIASFGAMASEPVKAKNIVLVHGAFADGSSWNQVASLLMDRGFHVVAVQNPLTSLDDDVAATQRAIDAQDGPVVLVGHSWAGVVITEAGANAKVSSLVYVAAFAPDVGQSLDRLQSGLPPPVWAPLLIKDKSGFLTLPAAAFEQHFAQDLPSPQVALLAVSQGPWFSGCLSDKVRVAAWRFKPTWYVLASEDHMITPDLQASMALKIKATVMEVVASHVPMLSQPQAVADAIATAAGSP